MSIEMSIEEDFKINTIIKNDIDTVLQILNSLLKNPETLSKKIIYKKFHRIIDNFCGKIYIGLDDNLKIYLNKL